jgi:nuclear transport factor 2 (NTF2) superfamily protein
MVTLPDFDRWLRTYGRAWTSRDPALVVTLFTEDASYHETPFGEPARGIEGIREYWTANTRVQQDVRFSYEILALWDGRGVARWWAEYTRVPSGTRARLDGVFLLEFADDGRCRRLREWWHRRDEPAAQRSGTP